MRITTLCLLIFAVSVISAADPLGSQVYAQQRQQSVVCAFNPYPFSGAKCWPPTGLTLKWSYGVLPEPSGYKLYFGTTSDPPLIMTAAWAKSAHLPTRVALKLNTKYYWKVVPTSGSGSATGCPVWNFTTISLACATNPHPVGTEEMANAIPTFTWAMSPVSQCAPSGYEVYFGTTSNPPFIKRTTGTRYTPNSFIGGTNYYWKVVPYNDYGAAIGCPTWTYTLPLRCAIYPFPSDSATLVSPTNLILKWGIVPNPEPTGYELYFGTTSNPPLIKTVSTWETSAAAPASLDLNTKYYWKVIPTAFPGAPATGCPVWSFTTAGP
jgi:hypothetical protein